MNFIGHWFLALFTFSLFTSSWAGPIVVPDFKIEVTKNAKKSLWVLTLTPPEKHHFNIKAPMDARVLSSQALFNQGKVTEKKVIFEKNNSALSEKDSVLLNVYLCDQASTYCIKKQMTIPLVPSKHANSMISAPIFLPELEKISKIPLKVKAKKDQDGFWDNEPELAIAEAQKTGKLLMIDFYGIWCPPCNQYGETVFPKRKFKDFSKKIVLLKMDADRELSWKLKSHFKVGGYPTIVFSKVGQDSKIEKQGQENDLKEIDRVVGFFPLEEFLEKAKLALLNKDTSLSERVLVAKGNYLELLVNQIKTTEEQGNTHEALRLIEEGLRVEPENNYFKLMNLKLSVSENASVLEARFKEKTTQSLIEQVLNQYQSQSVDTLLLVQEICITHSRYFNEKVLRQVVVVIDELAKRINPKTLKIDGVEISIADLDSLKIDAAEALKDEALEKSARNSAIASYRKLMELEKNPESRGLNLELAYLLRKDGKIEESKAIYDRFMKRYPQEFTFYFAASKLYLDIKDFAKAEELAHHAVDVAYGDHQIRSVDQWVKVLLAQGKKEEAKKIGQTYLPQFKYPKEFQIRTGRYLEQLKKTLAEIKS